MENMREGVEKNENEDSQSKDTTKTAGAVIVADESSSSDRATRPPPPGNGVVAAGSSLLAVVPTKSPMTSLSPTTTTRKDPGTPHSNEQMHDNDDPRKTSAALVLSALHTVASATSSTHSSPSSFGPSNADNDNSLKRCRHDNEEQLRPSSAETAITSNTTSATFPFVIQDDATESSNLLHCADTRHSLKSTAEDSDSHISLGGGIIVSTSASRQITCGGVSQGSSSSDSNFINASSSRLSNLSGSPSSSSSVKHGPKFTKGKKRSLYQEVISSTARFTRKNASSPDAPLSLGGKIARTPPSKKGKKKKEDADDEEDENGSHVLASQESIASASSSPFNFKGSNPYGVAVRSPWRGQQKQDGLNPQRSTVARPLLVSNTSGGKNGTDLGGPSLPPQNIPNYNYCHANHHNHGEYPAFCYPPPPQQQQYFPFPHVYQHPVDGPHVPQPPPYQHGMYPTIPHPAYSAGPYHPNFSRPHHQYHPYYPPHPPPSSYGAPSHQHFPHNPTGINKNSPSLPYNYIVNKSDHQDSATTEDDETEKGTDGVSQTTPSEEKNKEKEEKNCEENQPDMLVVARGAGVRHSTMEDQVIVKTNGKKQPQQRENKKKDVAKKSNDDNISCNHCCHCGRASNSAATPCMDHSRSNPYYAGPRHCNPPHFTSPVGPAVVNPSPCHPNHAIPQYGPHYQYPVPSPQFYHSNGRYMPPYGVATPISQPSTESSPSHDRGTDMAVTPYKGCAVGGIRVHEGGIESVCTFFVTPPPIKKRRMSSTGSMGSSPPQREDAGSTASTSGAGYSRKDKSLGLLCENFMTLYGRTGCDEKSSSVMMTKAKDQNQDEEEEEEEVPCVSIDEAAKALGVERRRIYDIINILESVHIVSRKCKNTYRWHGTTNLANFFVELQRDALGFWRDDAVENGLIVEEKIKDYSVGLGGKPVKIASGGSKFTQLQQQDQAESGLGDVGNLLTTKEKSLGKLTQKFIQLFLVGHNVINLTFASEKILGCSSPEELVARTKAENLKKTEGRGDNTKTTRKKDPSVVAAAEKAANAAGRGLKTKIRRLYDIANVMVSLGIIERLSYGGGNNNKNKPSFRWAFQINPKDMPNMSAQNIDLSQKLNREGTDEKEMATPHLGDAKIIKDYEESTKSIGEGEEKEESVQEAQSKSATGSSPSSCSRDDVDRTAGQNSGISVPESIGEGKENEESVQEAQSKSATALSLSSCSRDDVDSPAGQNSSISVPKTDVAAKIAAVPITPTHSNPISKGDC